MARKPATVAIADVIDAPTAHTVVRATPGSITVPRSAAVALRSNLDLSIVETFADRASAASASSRGKAIPVFAASVVVGGAETLTVSGTAASGAALVEMIRAALDSAGAFGDAVLGAVTFSETADGKSRRISPSGERGFRSAVNRAYHAVAYPQLGIAVGVVRTGFIAAE